MNQRSERTWEQQIDDAGEFQRRPTAFRNRVTEGGDFPVESGRYHLYVSFACPWAHRTLITRSLKGLEDHISVDVVDYVLGPNGWSFDAKNAGETGDTVNSFSLLREAYERSSDGYRGSITVPVLWDKVRGCIVNNESSEIIRILNAEFQRLAKHPLDLYPAALRKEIDAVNEWVYSDINNGVYRCGFARSQAAYDAAVTRLFDALDRVESILQDQRYLAGSSLTEADVRLVTTLIRFDSVYHTHFKCNVRRIVDYPALWAYCRDLFSLPAVRETTNMDHIRHHYYQSHAALNPYGIVPPGPTLDWDAPHKRAMSFNTTQLG